MNNDFAKLKEIFTMAEVLTSDNDGILEILTVDEHSNKSARVIFNFNDYNELTEVYVEE
jgi:hypothetical protein